MRLILLPLVALATPLGARETALANSAPVCRPIAQHEASSPDAVTVRPLGQEPPARQILAVLRTEGGCQRPIVVRDSVGTNPYTSATNRP